MKNLLHYLNHCLMAALLINVVLIVGLVALNRETQVYEIGHQFPVIAGIDLEGSYKESSPNAPCHLIRVTADNCQYCRVDQDLLDTIVSVARNMDCEIVAFAPRAGLMAALEDESILQLKFIAMDMGEATYPFLTPQTIALDSDRRVVWSKMGALDESAMKRGIRAVSR